MFYCNLGLFIEISGLFEKKQHVVRSISRDIFQIKLDEISFSSEKIEKKSRIHSRFVGRMTLNSRRMHYFLSSLLKILTKNRLAI